LLCAVCVTVVMWIFSLLPEFVPALFVVLISILLGVVPPEVALSGFGSKSFFMALRILGLSVVITVSGLSYRALLVLLRIGPANKVWYNICLFATGVALTPVVPTANGRISIVTPFLVDLLGAFDKNLVVPKPLA
jgi:DASS family divalent anion:Na+ symporter